MCRAPKRTITNNSYHKNDQFVLDSGFLTKVAISYFTICDFNDCLRNGECVDKVIFSPITNYPRDECLGILVC